MRADATRGGAQVAAPTPAAEHRPGGSSTKGFAGGSHRGTIYRHAPRPNSPAPRPGGPRPRRPPTASHAAAHHDEHAIHPDDLRAACEETARQLGTSTGGGRQPFGASTRQPPAPPVSKDAPPPRVRMLTPAPPVTAGAAARGSLGPEVAMLFTQPPTQGTPWPALFGALASAFFAGGAKTAQRVDAAKAARHHLPPQAGPVTLAAVKDGAIAWMAAQQRHNPADTCTPQQQNDHLLFPLYMLGSFRPRDAQAHGGADARAQMLLRGLDLLPGGTR
ncbi:hypothetical protein [Ideonella sp.]|uniref:hypothetical protein n=1 Tax=Ideonella sp. TaxID=1929293 RepID=UPI0035B159F1